MLSGTAEAASDAGLSPPSESARRRARMPPAARTRDSESRRVAGPGNEFIVVVTVAPGSLAGPAQAGPGATSSYSGSLARVAAALPPGQAQASSRLVISRVLVASFRTRRPGPGARHPAGRAALADPGRRAAAAAAFAPSLRLTATKLDDPSRVDSDSVGVTSPRKSVGSRT